MTTAIIISTIILIVGTIIMIIGCFKDGRGVFFGGVVTTIISFVVVMCLVIINDRKNIQKQTKEYPASEYTFKIKVVEFEQQKDTILVVIPKEK